MSYLWKYIPICCRSRDLEVRPPKRNISRTNTLYFEYDFWKNPTNLEKKCPPKRPTVGTIQSQ